MSNQDWNWLEVLCQDFDRARSLTVLLMVRYDEWDQLVTLRCYPSEYCPLFQSIDDFRFDYQITELLRKCSDLPLKHVNPESAAIKSYVDSELKCAETNARLSVLAHQMRDWYQPSRHDKRWEGVVKEWRNQVRLILSDLPSELTPKFSSGSTFDDKRFILPQDKMSSRPTCTRDAYEIVEPFWRHTLWAKSLCVEKSDHSLPKFTLGNRFTMVPKDATKHRGICIEPSLNVTYQLSLGTAIRERLRTHGIDLKYGQPLHQRLAQGASMRLDVGTIDLSSASDSICTGLVHLVLPPIWAAALDALRSKHTLIQGQWKYNQKFSSMGNGFTFELETLLFYTLALTVAKLCNHQISVCSVYGDDIIIDTPIARHLVTALRFFGFTTNDRKTFIDGTPFRESCGGDFYRGTNVRGYYLEKLPTEPIDWIKLANGIRRMAGPDLDAFGDLYRYKRSWLRALSHLPTDIRRCRGPSYLGDIVVHDDRSTWVSTWRKGERCLKTVQPTFGKDAYTRYDRKFWTRGSILSAITLGLLRDQGDVHCWNEQKQTWQLLPGKQKLSRIEPVGHKVVAMPYSGALSDPNPLYDSLVQDFLSKSSKRTDTAFVKNVVSSFWCSWLITNC